MSKLSGVLWNLNSNSNSPVAPRRLEQPDFCQSAQSRNERECKQTLKNMCQARVMIIISNNYIISTNQHFKSTFSIQISEFQRHSCKRSFLFFFFPDWPRELTRRLMLNVEIIWVVFGSVVMPWKWFTCIVWFIKVIDFDKTNAGTWLSLYYKNTLCQA